MSCGIDVDPIAVSVKSARRNVMQVLVISSSPNRDGLTAACAQAADRRCALGGRRGRGGAPERPEGGDVPACDDGRGTCRDEHRCQVEDDFQALYARMSAADAGGLRHARIWGVAPVSGSRAYTDRACRCLGLAGEGPGTRTGEPVMVVAAAGGTGNGMLDTCLEDLERWIQQHVHARKTHSSWRRRASLATIRWGRSTRPRRHWRDGRFAR